MNQLRNGHQPAGSAVRPHMGKMLSLAAKQYPTVHFSMLEVVQNAIDGGAKRILVRVNQGRRSIVVFDDGNGVDVDKFNQALEQVGVSQKIGEKDKFGRFGLGLVAFLGKCKSFTFTSRKQQRGYAPYNTWSFVTKKIENQKDSIVIPRKEEDTMRHGTINSPILGSAGTTRKGKRFTIVNWRSRFEVTEYTPDRTMGKMLPPLEFAEQVFAKFGTIMHKRKIALTLEYTDSNGKLQRHVDLRAPEYPGERLPTKVEHASDGARTTFQLYLLAKGSAIKGKVNVLEEGNPFRVPFTDFAKKATGYLSSDCVKALQSGCFAGEICNERVQLHENRTQFVENDAFVDLCTAIERWFEETGYFLYEELLESQNDERLQRLGRESMETLNAMLHQDEYQHLVDRMRQFSNGTIGEGHTPPNPADVNGQQTTKSATKLKKPAVGQDKPKQSQRKGEESTDQKSREGHTPLSVVGPKGQRRTLVKSHSFGLQFAHEQMPGEKRLWILDDTQGVLRFNCRHPAWERCESSDNRIKRLQELIAIQALHSLLLPPEWREQFDEHLTEVAIGHAFLLAESPSFTPGKKLPKLK